MKLFSAVLLGTASAELEFDDLGKNSGNTARQERTLGNLSIDSANKISTVQAGGRFPHVNDILYTQSQAQMFASLGMSVPSHQISSAPAWKEQLETNGNARGLANTVLDGRLWTQHPYPANCDFETNSQCKWLVPFYYAAGTSTQARERISAAMANIEAKTCLRFQFLSNPGHSTYLNKKKLRVVTTTNLCASYVGANYQEQEIYLSQNPADNCGLNATAVEHEILHSIGLYHENQRPDVEDYIKYDWTAIRPDMTQQQINTDYGVIPAAQFLDYDSAFDFRSIMLIGSTDNARPCTNTDGSICKSTMNAAGTEITMCSNTCGLAAGGTGEFIKQCDNTAIDAVNSRGKFTCDYYPHINGKGAGFGNYGQTAGETWDATASAAFPNAATETPWDTGFPGATLALSLDDLGMTDSTVRCAACTLGGGADCCSDAYTCVGNCAAPHPSQVFAGLPGGFDPMTYQTYMRVYTKIDTGDTAGGYRAFQNEAGTAYNLATSLSNDDAWQINSLYGCEAYKKEYMHKCDNGRYEMTHSFGMDLKCNSRADMCPVGGEDKGGYIQWNVADGSAMQGDLSEESICHACAVGQHSCDPNASCTMLLGPNSALVAVLPEGDPDPNCASIAGCTAGDANTPPAPSDSYPGCSCDIVPKPAGVPVTLIGDTAITNPTGSAGEADDYLKGNGSTVVSGGTGCIDVNECVDVTKCRFEDAGATVAVRLPCVNHDPGFECVCPAGKQHPEPYEENKFQHLEECVDLDECATGTHECPSNTICHNLFCEGDAFLGKPCGYGEGYVCACPYNTYLASMPAYSIEGGVSDQATVCNPTTAETIPSFTSGCIKGLNEGAAGILHPEHPDFTTDIAGVADTNVVALGHPSTGFTCPNMNQCGVQSIWSRTLADVSAFMVRDQCLICKATGLPVIGTDGSVNSNCINDPGTYVSTDYWTNKWYDPGTICIDYDDGIAGQPTHTCRCPKGAAPEYYTHSFFAQFDMDDGILDGKITLTQELKEKGWFDIKYYLDGTDGCVGCSVGTTTTHTAVNAALVEYGFDTSGTLSASSHFAADDGNTAYGIQFSSQFGNNDGQTETFPSTLGVIAFFVVKFDAASNTWTSDIPWQCVQINHCSNTICPGRTVRGVGCRENPFYSLTNFFSRTAAEATALNDELALFSDGYYDLGQILADPSAATFADPPHTPPGSLQDMTQGPPKCSTYCAAATTNTFGRDDGNTSEAGDTDTDPQLETDSSLTSQGTVDGAILFWDKVGNQWHETASTADVPALWMDSSDYGGVAEGLPFCDTCDNVLTEWNYFDQVCSDRNECEKQQSLYDLYVKDHATVLIGGSLAEAAYVLDHDRHCSTPYFPDSTVRRNNIMPAGSSISSTTAISGAFHMDCVNRGPYNSDHGFVCECPAGSVLNDAGDQCVDVQECRLGQHTCGWLPCVDYCAHGSSDGEILGATWDSTYSSCDYGADASSLPAYTVAGFGTAQVVTPGGANQMANFRPGGGYTCECPTGLRWNATTRTCDDINECVEMDAPCGYVGTYPGDVTQLTTLQGTRCVNTEGTYWCACQPGYYNEDLQAQFVIGQDDRGENIYIDPELCDATKCQKPQDATINLFSATLGVYCQNEGLIGPAAGTGGCSCLVINMCTSACYELDDDGLAYTTDLASGSVLGHNCHTCHPNAECRTNYKPNGQMAGTYDCYCSINSTQDGRNECNDGDQCAAGAIGALDCATKGLACNNLDNGYECVCLNSSGYSVDPTSGHCVDIDECTETPDVCGADGQCINADGTYTCTCYNGFDLVVAGRSVVAIPGDNMSAMRTSHGGRSPAGIVQDDWQIFAINQVASQSRTGGRERQFTCKDTDECATGNNYCIDANLGGTCINVQGGHTCSCAAGYVGDGNDQEKYNALVLGLGHDTTLNNNQSTGWVAPGFDGHGSTGGTLPVPSSFVGCVDVDECLSNNGGCHSTAVCVNLAGSSECRCPVHLPIGSGTSGCYAANDPVVTVAPIVVDPVVTAAPVTAAPVLATTTLAPETHSGPMVYNDFNCAGMGSVCEFFSCANDITVHCFGGSTCGVSCKNGMNPMGMSAVSCTNTGKAKKQGWKNGGKKLSGGEALTCGAAVNPPTGGGAVSSGGSSSSSGGAVSSGGWCGVGDLNAYFGVGSQYKFNCKAGSKKCKVKCSGGGKPNPKKLKCSGGKLKTSSMGGC